MLQGWMRGHERSRNEDFLTTGPAAAEEVTGVTTGLAEGTRVATAVGWQRIETIRAGDAVLTFDNGLQTVRAVYADPLWSGSDGCPDRFCPLHVPAGAIGNSEELLALPQQGVMVESDISEAHYGDPFALMPVHLLEGICGIERVLPDTPVKVYMLQFDNDEILFTASGAMCVCPAAGDMVHRAFDAAPAYRLLSGETDGVMVESIRDELVTQWHKRLASRRAES